MLKYSTLSYSSANSDINNFFITLYLYIHSLRKKRVGSRKMNEWLTNYTNAVNISSYMLFIYEFFSFISLICSCNFLSAYIF